MIVHNLTWYDILSFSLLTINIIGTFYISYKCSSYKQFEINKKSIIMAKLLMHGIGLIEVLFLISLHAWIVDDMGAAIGYISSFSSKMYTLGEIVKSLFFLCVIVFTHHWLELKKIEYKDCD